MSALATKEQAVDVEDDADVFNGPLVPAVDGFRAEKITVRFVGVIDLDRTSTEDLDFVNALRLGAPVRVIATGSVSGKGFRHRPTADGEEVSYYAALRVDGLEIGEAA